MVSPFPEISRSSENFNSRYAPANHCEPHIFRCQMKEHSLGYRLILGAQQQVLARIAISRVEVTASRTTKPLSQGMLLQIAAKWICLYIKRKRAI